VKHICGTNDTCVDPHRHSSHITDHFMSHEHVRRWHVAISLNLLHSCSNRTPGVHSTSIRSNSPINSTAYRDIVDLLTFRILCTHTSGFWCDELKYFVVILKAPSSEHDPRYTLLNYRLKSLVEIYPLKTLGALDSLVPEWLSQSLTMASNTITLT
jgi:hypothetical protein